MFEYGCIKNGLPISSDILKYLKSTFLDEENQRQELIFGYVTNQGAFIVISLHKSHSNELSQKCCWVIDHIYIVNRSNLRIAWIQPYCGKIQRNLLSTSQLVMGLTMFEVWCSIIQSKNAQTSWARKRS